MMKTIGAREVEVMVVEVCRCWRRPTRSGIGTWIRLCGGSSAEASVVLPWAVSMASVAPVVDDVAAAAAATGVAVAIVVAEAAVAGGGGAAAAAEMFPSD